MDTTPKRWIQRFESFKKALERLSFGLDIEQPNEFEIQGILKSFEFTYELSWGLLKDYLLEEGASEKHPLVGSKSVFRLAIQTKLIADSDIWQEMVADRNLSVHAYDEEIALQIYTKLKSEYIQYFKELSRTFDAISTRSKGS